MTLCILRPRTACAKWSCCRSLGNGSACLQFRRKYVWNLRRLPRWVCPNENLPGLCTGKVLTLRSRRGVTTSLPGQNLPDWNLFPEVRLVAAFGPASPSGSQEAAAYSNRTSAHCRAGTIPSPSEPYLPRTASCDAGNGRKQVDGVDFHVYV